MRGSIKKYILILILTSQAFTVLAANNCHLGVSNKTCACTKSTGSMSCGYRLETFCSGTDYYNTTLATPSRWASTDICDPGMPVVMESSGLNLQPGTEYSISLVGYNVLGQTLCSYNDTLVCTGPDASSYNCTSCDDCNTKIEDSTPGDRINLAADITNEETDCLSISGKYDITFDCQDRTIAGIEDYKWYYYGVEITDSSLITIKNCRVVSFGTGIFLDDCSGCTLKNNTANNGSTGIYFYGSETENVVLSGNIASNNTEGIHIYSARNCTLDNNTANGNSETGFYIEYLDSSTIDNNKAEGNSEKGIYADSLYDSRIKGNTADNNGYGIYVTYSEKDTLSHNYADNNTENGISILYCASETLENNTAEHNSGGIRLLYTDNSTFARNNAGYNRYDGFNIELSDNNSFANNSASGNAGSGFYLELSDSNTIQGNHANWNNHGIHLYYSDHNSFHQNTADNNTGIGIYMGSSNNNSLSDNAAGHNSDGMHIDASEENTIDANAFCGNDIFDVDQPVYLDNRGRNNTCDRTSNWNETGAEGCTYSCGILADECSMPGDSPPCGEISLDEVVSAINNWAIGGRTLPEVIALINEWAAAT